MLIWDNNGIYVANKDYEDASFEDKKLIKEHFSFVDDKFKMFFTKKKHANYFFEDELKITGMNFHEFIDYYKHKRVEYSEINILKNQKPLHLNTIIVNNLFYKELEDISLYTVMDKNQDLIRVSPFLFDLLKTEKDQSIIFAREVLSMIFLSNKVVFKNNNIILEYSNQIDLNREIEINWNDKKINNEFYFEALKWVLHDDQRGIGLKQKKNIVNNFICNNHIGIVSTNLDLNIVRSKLDSALMVILSGRTQEYFRLQENLKSDRVKNYYQSAEITKGVEKGILGSMTITLTSILAKVITDEESFQNVLRNIEFRIIILWISLISTVLVLLYTVASILSYRKVIDHINKIYIETFHEGAMIEKEKFVIHLIVLVTIILLLTTFLCILYFSKP